jgi:hypothetical protein
MGFDEYFHQFLVKGGGRGSFHTIANHPYSSGDANIPCSVDDALPRTRDTVGRLGMQNIWMSEFAKLYKLEHRDREPLNLAVPMHLAFVVVTFKS